MNASISPERPALLTRTNQINPTMNKQIPLPSKSKSKPKRKTSWRAHVGGKYLTKEDFPEPQELLVEAAREEETQPLGKEPEIKWVLYFEGLTKGLPMNLTNSQFMEKLTGSEFPEDWVGATVEAFNDESVMMGAERVGGVRLREPQSVSAN
jgi:hypothetical protein